MTGMHRNLPVSSATPQQGDAWNRSPRVVGPSRHLLRMPMTDSPLSLAASLQLLDSVQLAMEEQPPSPLNFCISDQSSHVGRDGGMEFTISCSTEGSTCPIPPPPCETPPP